LNAGIKILITGKMTDDGLAYLRKGRGLFVDYKPGLTGADLSQSIRDANALIIRTETKVTRELLSNAQKLEVICRSGIGIDNIDMGACSEKQIVVMNTPSANRVSTAEHAIALIFALARHIPQASAAVRNGEWNREKFMGTEVQLKTLGIIGLGNIGQRVATRAQAMHMTAIAHDPYLDHSVASAINVKLFSRDEVLAKSDFVSVHVPLNDETRSLCDEKFFAAMKKGAYFINASRGPVVDEMALAQAVSSGHLAGAGLDVMHEEPPPADHPLFKDDRVIFTPHVAGQTTESQYNMSMDAAVQIRDFFEEGTIVNAIVKW